MDITRSDLKNYLVIPKQCLAMVVASFINAVANGTTYFVALYLITQLHFDVRYPLVTRLWNNRASNGKSGCGNGVNGSN